MIPLIDTHCHLDLFKDIQANSQKENLQGVKTISVTNAPSFFKKNVSLFKDHENIRIALGLHPQLVHQFGNEIKLFEELLDSTRYVGEIGLDGSKELKATFLLQQKIFNQILFSIKRTKGKVLTVHSRNAASDVLDSLSTILTGSNTSVILHWFTGNKDDLLKGVKKQFYFSVNHKMVGTEKGKETIRNIPQHLLLTETDAPFTITENIASRIRSLEFTLESIATIKRISIEECKHLIFENFKRTLSQ